MFDVLDTQIKPFILNNSKILEVAYELYLAAPQDSHPMIDLHVLAKRTGKSMLQCRNEIVEANKLGHFPNCSLQS